MSQFIGGLWGRLPIGWLQLRNNKTRLVAAVGGVTFANVLFFMQLGFMNALFETSVFSHRSLDADIVLVSSDFRSLREANPLPRSRMYQALSIPGVRSATPIYLGTRFWTDTATGDTTNFRVIGVDPNADVFEDQVLSEKTHHLLVPDTAIVDQRTRDFNSTIQATLQSGRSVNAEYATFKAIGYPPRFFFSVVLEEALSLAALGFIPGLVICVVLYQLAAAKTGLPITMPWTRPLFVFFLTAAMCTISGVIATRRLNAADPAELF